MGNETQTIKSKAPDKNVLKCEKYLRTVYPHFYRKISGYRMAGKVSEIDFERIKAFAEIYHIILSEIEFVLFPFLGIKEYPVDSEKEPVSHFHVEDYNTNIKTLDNRHKFTY